MNQHLAHRISNSTEPRQNTRNDLPPPSTIIAAVSAPQCFFFPSSSRTVAALIEVAMHAYQVYRTLRVSSHSSRVLLLTFLAHKSKDSTPTNCVVFAYCACS